MSKRSGTRRSREWALPRPAAPHDHEALAKLAQAINQEHRQVQLAFKTGLLRVVRIGKLLRQAKAQVGHGKWLNWIEEHTDLTRRTVSNYMRISRILPTISNETLVSHLRQCDVLRLPSAASAKRAEGAPSPAAAPDAGASTRGRGSCRAVGSSAEDGPAKRALASPESAVAQPDAYPAGAEPFPPAVAGDVDRLAAEMRRLIAGWPTGFHPRRALAHCLETLAREVRATIPLAG